MKTAIWCILANLAWLASAADTALLAQQNGMLPEPVPAGPTLPLAQPNAGPPTSLPEGTALFDGAAPMLPQAGLGGPAAGLPPLPRACEDCGTGDCAPPLWSFNQGVRALNRGKPRDLPVSAETFYLSQFGAYVLDPVISSRSLDFGVAAGYALTVSRYLGRDKENRDDFLEFTYWGMNQWDESLEAQGERLALTVSQTQAVSFGSLFSPFDPTPNVVDTPLGGFNRADWQSIEYLSEIHSFEWNVRLQPRGRPDRLVLHPDGRWRRECQPGQYVSYAFGLRYLTLNESFYFRSSSRIDIFENGNLVSSRMNTGDYGIFTNNNLLGLNFGGDMTFRRCRTQWGVRGKVGPFVNFAHHDSHTVTNAFGDPVPLLFNKDPINLDNHREMNNTAVSVIGELGIFGSYRFKPNVVAHLSYDIAWITGLALAAEHLTYQVTPPNFIKTDGSLFLQGVTIKLETTW